MRDQQNLQRPKDKDITDNGGFKVGILIAKGVTDIWQKTENGKFLKERRRDNQVAFGG